MRTMDMDLGSLMLESKTSDLQLQLSGLAKFTPSAEDDIATLKQRLTHEALNPSSINRPWITRGNAFRLELSLDMGNILDIDDHETLIEGMTARLKTAKFWQQLFLSATSIESSILSTRWSLITVFLAHVQTGSEGSRPSVHKLEHDTPFYDVQPPAGIFAAALDCVHLEIRIQTSRQHKRRKLKRRYRGSGDPPDSSEGLSPLAKDSFHDTAVSLTPSDVELPNTRGMTHSNLLLTLSESFLEPDDEEMIDLDPVSGLDDNCADTLTQKQSFEKAPALLKRSSSISDLETNEPSTCIGAILHMVDAAIRMAISDSRRQLPKNISLTESESFRHLAELVPTLWSPGYLPAVACRAVFLPTIGHALDSVCKRHAESQEINSRRSPLASDREDTFIDTKVGVSSPAGPSTYSSPLWKALQRRMYDPMAAKRLQPLTTTVDVNATDSQPRDEILHTSQEVFCRDALHVEQDDDLLQHQNGFEGISQDILCGDGNESSLTAPHELVETARFDVKGVGGIGTGGGGRVSDDDLLSICGSLSSITLTEDDSEDLEDCNICDGPFEGPKCSQYN